MPFYIYQLVEPLILPNTLINLSAISHQSSAIHYKLSIISYKLSAICYFYRTEPRWSNLLPLRLHLVGKRI